jgi:GNAT superfamily N-acetyltransferase
VGLRRAVEEDAMPVIRVLHGALLEIDGSTVREAVDRGDVIVADADGWVVGALVLEDNHIDTLAVRREHRKQGLGSALVETAVAEIGGPVTADFRAGVRGFWADLGFEIESDGARFYGIRR